MVHNFKYKMFIMIIIFLFSILVTSFRLIIPENEEVYNVTKEDYKNIFK